MLPKQQKENVKQKIKFYQKAWFMWIWLILFPPLGIFLMWKTGKFSIIKRIIATIIATGYFALPIIIAIFTTPSLYYSQEELLKSFNKEVDSLGLSYFISDTKVEDGFITSKLDENITLIENIDDNDKIQELIMVGQGEGLDIILLMGVFIGMTNPTLSQEEVGQVLNDLHLFDEDYDYQESEETVKKGLIRYHLKYDQTAGVIFSVSKAN
ncbi:hypothetical protein JOC34_001554 [Virgibacillus halotolerans]|uniref:hypothetical protein n=1 Tax=Virgibacillus halotolerans TaxID=1071053 RepID=UPI001961FDE9|nr:hypothetical protein [Virgibacillus halotolerans]MBM7599186.1 hypothetical protein [Virgibacillus halotolerans]